MKQFVEKLQTIDLQQLARDFQNLNPKDAGAWPLAPRIAVIIGIFLALMLFGWLLVWTDQLAALDEKEQQQAKLKEEFLSKKAQADNLDMYTQQLAEIDRVFGALLKQLPSRTEVDALLTDVNQAGLGRGLQFQLFKPAPEAAKEFYAELPVSVRMVGKYHDFAAFAADIARLSRIVTLNNLTLFIPSSGQGSGQEKLMLGVLGMEVTLKTFRYLDEEEVIQNRKAAKEAKK